MSLRPKLKNISYSFTLQICLGRRIESMDLLKSDRTEQYDRELDARKGAVSRVLVLRNLEHITLDISGVVAIETVIAMWTRPGL